MKRGDEVIVRGILWQEARCETVIIQVPGGHLVAVPEGAAEAAGTAEVPWPG